jgi:hypothetical protein
LELACNEEVSAVALVEQSFVWCWEWDTSEIRSEVPGKFWNVVLEKDGEDHLDRSCEKWSTT